MGKLDEDGLAALVAAGCAACATHKLLFRTYVDGLVPIMGGDPIGRVTWVYDGEKFVDGVYQVSCLDCRAELFSAADCPRCHREGGLAIALAEENRWPVPERCAQCEGEELRYIGFFPAQVRYEGKRGDKARTTTELHEPGFHGYRVDCKRCGTLAELVTECPLCAAPGPLRERP